MIESLFYFASLFPVDEGKTFSLKSDEKERLKKAIINFLTKEDFNYDHRYHNLVVKWPDPEKTPSETEPAKE